MAPILSKSGAKPSAKSGSSAKGLLGKTTTSKSDAMPTLGGKSSKVTIGKPPIGSFGASSKNYPSAVYSSPKSSKSSTTFGVIWIPKRKNKKKDMIYNPHQDYKHHPPPDRSPSMYGFMSGDSSENQPLEMKDNKPELFTPEQHLTSQPHAEAIAILKEPKETKEKDDKNNINEDTEKSEEKQSFIRPDREDSKEGRGDSNDRDERGKEDKDYLEDDSLKPKSPDTKHQEEKYPDKVDSVYLRPPPPNKARSAASTQDEEDCGVKCLYYTLQCCDCTLM